MAKLEDAEFQFTLTNQTVPSINNSSGKDSSGKDSMALNYWAGSSIYYVPTFTSATAWQWIGLGIDFNDKCEWCKKNKAIYKTPHSFCQDCWFLWWHGELSKKLKTNHDVVTYYLKAVKNLEHLLEKTNEEVK